MCGIFGYVGNASSKKHVLEGLERLEYRGYDSSGFVCISQTDLVYHKTMGSLSNLVKKIQENPIDGQVGMGHIRWATHGGLNIDNAHPHFDCYQNISLVHNGTIENYSELHKKLLNEGHILRSQTDSEVIAHILETELEQNHNDLISSVVATISQLKGAYALLFVLKNFPDKMLVVRKKNPICLGIGESETFVASDYIAFAGKTNRIVFMPDESFAIVTKNVVNLYDFKGNALECDISLINSKFNFVGKEGFEHFMLKEIYEQKKVVNDTVSALKSLDIKIWEVAGLSLEKLNKLQSVNLIGAGTSWHAAKIAQFYFEEIALLPTRVHLASEFNHMPLFLEPESVYIAVSQSGETLDTLESVSLINSMHKTHTIGLTNNESSALVRQSNGLLLMHAGMEVAVASTKAFTAQVATLYYFANRAAYEKGIINRNMLERACDDLCKAAEVLEFGIDKYKFEITNELAPFYSKFKNFIFLGRHISYPIAQEAALKLKEISYCFADSFPAGELKHGTLALIDENVPVIIVSSINKSIYSKLVLNAQEVKARGGHIISIAFEGQDELCNLSNKAFILPRVQSLLEPIAMAGIIQFFAYQIANSLGRPIDKPRNLAKSVTVE